MTPNLSLPAMLEPSLLPVPPTPPPGYASSATLLQNYPDKYTSEGLDTSESWHAGEDDYEAEGRRHHIHSKMKSWLCTLVGVGITTGLYTVYPSPTTVPLFVGLAFTLMSWVVITWTGLVMRLAQKKEGLGVILSRYSARFRLRLGLATTLLFWWTAISLVPMKEKAAPTLKGTGDKYFIAVDLHSYEAVLPNFIKEIDLLILHLGRKDVLLSIYDSTLQHGTQDSHGSTQSLTDLALMRNWPYDTSPERVQSLAHARNIAMEPLQSPHDSVRLPDWEEYTKVIFLNNIVFRWQDIVNLIATREEGKEDEGYDMACAMDYAFSGLYDTWVSRDICGTPLRAFWPFAEDKISQEAIRREQPFQVATCWNGAVVINAKPLRYSSNTTATSGSRLSARGWKAVDGDPSSGSRMSPPLANPIKFRTSEIDACDHSERFLLPYDLHRYYSETEGRPRILMNPAIKVAYEEKWYYWNNVFLRRPMIRWWRDIWSHNIGYKLFDWPFEYFGRRRDYCTWDGLKTPTLNDRCLPLPGAMDHEGTGLGSKT